MVFTIKEPPRFGHVVKLTNSSDSAASPVLDYIHTFSQEDIDQGRILYVSASIQVYCQFIYYVLHKSNVAAYFSFIFTLRLKIRQKHKLG